MTYVSIDVNGQKQKMVKYKLDGADCYYAGTLEQCEKYIKTTIAQRKKSRNVVVFDEDKAKPIIKTAWGPMSLH